MNTKFKLILFSILLTFVAPLIVDASACEVVSGTGKNLGDEIVCGTEHFYVLTNKNNKISMLSKYNLYVGDKIEKQGDYFDNYMQADAYCATLPTYDEGRVLTTTKYDLTGGDPKYFCRVYTPLEYTSVKQSELAKGLYPTGNMEVAYPIYGALFLDEEVKDGEFDENYNMVPEKSPFKEYFEGYKETLIDLGVEVIDIDFIKRDGIQSILDQVATSKIVIPTEVDYMEATDAEHPAWTPEEYEDYDMQFAKVNIGEYLPQKYKWLIGTSFWSGTAGHISEEYYDEFLTTVGDYCSYDRGCWMNKIGIGLRPVVTISTSQIESLNPETEDNFLIYIVLSLVSLLGLIVIKKEF